MTKDVSVGGISISCFSSIAEVISTRILTEESVNPGVGIAINPEKVITAANNPEIRDVINKATLRYPDGIGVSYVMSKKVGEPVARIPGCELWEHLMLASRKNEVPVFLVGASEKVICNTNQKLSAQGVNIVGYHNGYFNDADNSEIIDKIKDSKAKLITVALGSPRQELFIFECQKVIPEAFYMGVGGTYDVFTGNVKRAPWLFRKAHCEWLFRLLSQPTRLTRQINLFTYIRLYLLGKL